MELKTQTQKLKQELKAVKKDIAQLEAFDPTEDEFRDIDNVLDDDYSESELGFQVNEKLESLHHRQDRIKAALERIKSGIYGECVSCGKQIADKRLEAIPETPYCLECSTRKD